VHGQLQNAVLVALADAGISFVVAPFEADQQLVHLPRHSGVKPLAFAKAFLAGIVGDVQAGHWSYVVRTVPQQNNGCDCGPFVCRYGADTIWGKSLRDANDMVANAAAFRAKVLAAVLARATAGRRPRGASLSLRPLASASLLHFAKVHMMCNLTLYQRASGIREVVVPLETSQRSSAAAPPQLHAP